MTTYGPSYQRHSLPDSYERSSVPQALTDEWRASARKMAEDTVAAATSTAFRPKETNNGVEVAWYQEPDNPLIVMRGKTVIPNCTPEQMMLFKSRGDSAHYVEFMSTSDEMFVDGRTLLAVDGTPPIIDAAGNIIAQPEFPWISLRWGLFATPFPLNNRDFVFLQADLKLNDEWWVSCSSSVQHECFHSLEDLMGLVRGRMFKTGYVWRALTPTSIELIYIVQVDAAGIIPAWVQNQVAPEQAQNCARIRDLLSGVHKAAQSLGAVPHPSLEGSLIKLLKVKARGERRVRIVVPDGKAIVRWQFNVEDKNIYCHIECDTKQEVGEWRAGNERRYSTPTLGTLAVNGPVAVTIVFDNSYSKLTDKLVYFRCSVTREDGSRVVPDPLANMKLAAGYNGRLSNATHGVPTSDEAKADEPATAAPPAAVEPAAAEPAPAESTAEPATAPAAEAEGAGAEPAAGQAEGTA